MGRDAFLSALFWCSALLCLPHPLKMLPSSCCCNVILIFTYLQHVSTSLRQSPVKGKSGETLQFFFSISICSRTYFSSAQPRTLSTLLTSGKTERSCTFFNLPESKSIIIEDKIYAARNLIRRGEDTRRFYEKDFVFSSFSSRCVFVVLSRYLPSRSCFRDASAWDRDEITCKRKCNTREEKYWVSQFYEPSKCNKAHGKSNGTCH